ncbi:flagellar hook capping protein [Brevibacillus humidisoli]|uniref:flagellar hook assembly protein FlgD n=1 Tax=Brevibacillus humidisoli TaxID=2895522 RepID=UPI001E38B0CD|nr:flagellar hook capping FlgD N-terminal domain-containing protein [Brevibacillus humidisoli]UFJ40002.1 flagellar hook capping protein [Brevibacillus humidisoli]
MPNSVNDTVYIPPNWSYKGKKEFSTEIDQNSFMKLLIEQLKQQDPLSPMDNQQFVQQTTMMTMVERLTRIQTLMEESNSSLLNLPQYETLIGKTATYDMVTVDEATGEKSVEVKTDTINDVKMVDGKIMFVIGEDVVPRGNVHGLDSEGMSDDSLLDSALKFTQLLGTLVSYTEQEKVDADGDPDTTDDISTVDVTKQGTITGFNVKDGLIEFTLDNGKKLGMADIIGLEMAPDNIPMDNTLKYTQLIGYTVTYLEEVVNDDGSKESVEKTGTIDAVSMKNGLVEFLLADDQKISLRDIIGFEASNNG